jgi:hypothetical protein
VLIEALHFGHSVNKEVEDGEENVALGDDVEK